jgi:hypothetical protein
MAFGDGGGEGVEADDKNVGPWSDETGEAVFSGRYGMAFSTDRLE